MLNPGIVYLGSVKYLFFKLLFSFCYYYYIIRFFHIYNIFSITQPPSISLVPIAIPVLQEYSSGVQLETKLWTHSVFLASTAIKKKILVFLSLENCNKMKKKNRNLLKVQIFHPKSPKRTNSILPPFS